MRTVVSWLFRTAVAYLMALFAIAVYLWVTGLIKPWQHVPVLLNHQSWDLSCTGSRFEITNDPQMKREIAAATADVDREILVHVNLAQEAYKNSGRDLDDGQNPILGDGQNSIAREQMSAEMAKANDLLADRKNKLQSFNARWQARHYSIACWMVVAATSIVPGLVMFRLIHRRINRPPAGACRACGYDLRASPERCPECGHVTLQLHPLVKPPR